MTTFSDVARVAHEFIDVMYGRAEPGTAPRRLPTATAGISVDCRFDAPLVRDGRTEIPVTVVEHGDVRRSAAFTLVLAAGPDGWRVIGLEA